MDSLMSPDEVCDVLKLTKSTLYRFARDGKIPCVRLGSLIRFRRADVERVISGQEPKPTVVRLKSGVR